MNGKKKKQKAGVDGGDDDEDDGECANGDDGQDANGDDDQSSDSSRTTIGGYPGYVEKTQTTSGTIESPSKRRRIVGAPLVPTYDSNFDGGRVDNAGRQKTMGRPAICRQESTSSESSSSSSYTRLYNDCANGSYLTLSQMSSSDFDVITQKGTDAFGSGTTKDGLALLSQMSEILSTQQEEALEEECDLATVIVSSINYNGSDGHSAHNNSTHSSGSQSEIGAGTMTRSLSMRSPLRETLNAIVLTRSPNVGILKTQTTAPTTTTTTIDISFEGEQNEKRVLDVKGGEFRNGDDNNGSSSSSQDRGGLDEGPPSSNAIVDSLDHTARNSMSQDWSGNLLSQDAYAADLLLFSQCSSIAPLSQSQSLLDIDTSTDVHTDTTTSRESDEHVQEEVKKIQGLDIVPINNMRGSEIVPIIDLTTGDEEDGMTTDTTATTTCSPSQASVIQTLSQLSNLSQEFL
jgi:hypothetical protein